MSNEEIARGYYAAINERNLNALTSHVSDKCKLVDVARGKTITGKIALRKDCEGWLAGFPDGKVQVENVIAGGDYVCVEYIGKGTHTGTLGSGAEALAPTGRKVTLRFCDVLRFQKGELIGLSSYYDLASLMRQLEAVERPAARPEARPH